MNLIEQLGGYEKAKEELKEVEGILFVYADELKQALLQYRRKNNIYEVGDLCKLSVKYDYGLYKFLRMRDGRVSLEDRLGFAEFWIAAGVVSHATDAEIKANKREVG